VKRSLIGLFLPAIAILSACSPSEEAVQQAIAETVAAAPIPTNTPSPTETAIPIPPTPTNTATAQPTETTTPEPNPVLLSEIDLESIVLAGNEFLPPPLLQDFIEHELTTRQDILGELARPDNFIMQRLYNEDQWTGGAVLIFVYEDLDNVREAYARASMQLDGLGYDLGISYYDDIGERAKMEEYETRNYLIFPRCHAFVFIWTQGAREFDIVNYAKALDGLLQPVICIAE
jgi:hypothetical protein